MRLLPTSRRLVIRVPMRFIREQRLLVVLAALVSIGIATAAAQTSASSVSITSMSPANGATVSGNVAWPVSATGADHVDFLVDGSKQWTESKAPFMYDGDPDGRLDTTKLTDGSHTLTAVAYDTGGGSATATATVTVKNGTTSTAAPTPQASITQPSNGQTLSGSVPFVATGSGATVAKITFAVDGQTNWTETGAPYM